MDIFDTEAIKADMEREKKAEDSAFELCHTWCVAALNGFLKAAQEVGTPTVELHMETQLVRLQRLHGSLTAEKDGKTVAEYYQVFRDTSYSLEDDANVQGLNIALDGQIGTPRVPRRLYELDATTSMATS